MNRKILVSILALSLSASFAGCKTSPTVEGTAPTASNTEVHTDTEIKQPNGLNTDTDTVIDKSQLISSEDIKKITDTDTAAEKNTENTLSPSSIDIGGITFEAKLIPFDKTLKISDMEDIDSTVFGDTLYILEKKNLHTYTITDSSIIKENDIKLDNKYERVDADAFGNIYLSDSKFNAATLNDDGTVTELDLTGKLAMSKVMNFGLSSNGKDVIRKYVDGEIEEWLLDGTDTDTAAEEDTETDIETDTETDKATEDQPRFTKISDIEFSGNHILVGGSFNDGKDTLRAAVFDYDGNQTALTDNKISGDNIVSMTETDNGIIISTGSNLSLWQNDGTEIGQTKSSETAVLFGTENPVWINDVFAMDDGSVLMICSAENDKGEINVLAYSIRVV